MQDVFSLLRSNKDFIVRLSRKTTKINYNSQTSCQMASKDSDSQNGGGEAEQSEEGLNPAEINCPTDNSSSSSQQEVENFPEPEAGKKGDEAGHEFDSQTTSQMASKIPSLKNDDDLTETSIDGTKSAELISRNENSSSPSQQSTAQVENGTPPEAGTKGADAGHGNRFQSKLLNLYALRAIRLGYQFYLGTELSAGEKFDDLIFHYKGSDNNNRQQYLQAKHRLNENSMITADNLFDTNNGDFSLLKYFQSYMKIRGKDNDIEHCIICTNVDFDENLYEELEKYGMIVLGILKSHWSKLLNCKETKNEQACYKLKVQDIFKTTSFENIQICVTDCTGEELKILFKNCTEVVVNEKPFNEKTADEMKNFFTDSAQYQDQVEKTLIEKMFNDSKNTSSIRNWIKKCSGKEMETLFQNCTEKVNGKPFNQHRAGDMKNFFTNQAQLQKQVEKTLIETVFKDLRNTLSIRNWIVNCTDKERKRLFQNCTEKVNGNPFNQHTADEMRDFFIKKRNQEVKELVEIVFDNFLDKLMFAVKTPNEHELDSILTNEVGKHFELSNAVLQSAHFTNEMVNWFKNKDNNWLTAEKAKEILFGKTDAYKKMIELTSLSLDYQKKLKQIKTSENSELEFESTAINQLNFMKSFLESQEKIKHVISKTPKLTAVKVISAIKKLPEFPNKDDYLVISSKRLKEKKKKVRKSMKEIGHNLLVAVDEDAKNPIENDSFYEKFIPQKIKKKVIVISSQNFTKESYDEDTITYEQLNENTKKVLRERQVSFQGNNLTVNDLIDMKLADNVGLLDSQLIENLLQMAGDDQIVISSFNTSSHEKFLYIERKLKFPSKDQLLNKLADVEAKPNKKMDEQNKVKSKKINEEIEIDQNGKIKRKTEDNNRKLDIWKELKVLLEQNNSSIPLFTIVSESGLIDTSNKRIIITGVAGTGKSTILSHYYEIIKKNKSDNLVIKISLTIFSKILKETKNINDFLINNVVDQNSFARTLLKHRLEMSDRIILMLDGFDEIDTECQDKVVQLVRNLNESIPLYITTRPHLAEKLQFELSQLAYSLDKFNEDDQIDYMTSIWKEYLIKNKVVINDKKIGTFARQLIDRVNKTLKDKEKEFIGIPLQCRILAECFQSKIKDEIDKNSDDANLSHLIEDQQFDLANLYKLMIEVKRRVFREEKIKVNFGQSHIVDSSIENNILKTEKHLRKLAVQTVVHKQKHVDILIPSEEVQSESEREKEEKELNENGIRFGLLGGCSENGFEFLHRTYAEYLVADFIFNGFLLDEEKHNKLLDNKSVRKWIIEKMLIKGNYEGVRVFFNSLLKELLNEEWKNKIAACDLSNRLQKFALLCNWNVTNYNYNIVDDDDQVSILCLKVYKNNYYDYDDERDTVLNRAFYEMNSNIILFILDCLDVAFYQTPSTIPNFISVSIPLCGYFFFQSADLFARILHYFEKDNPSIKKTIQRSWYCLLDFCENKKFENQFKSENVKRFLSFMYDNLEQTETMKNDNEFKSIAVKLIYNKYEEISQEILKIETYIYSDDFDLIKLILWSTTEYLEEKNCEFGRIEKTIITLKDNGRDEVAAVVSRFVLFILFDKLKKEENANILSSLEETGMTGLHEAAFRGDLKFIENEIGCSLENPENCSKEKRNSILQLLANKNTPTYFDDDNTISNDDKFYYLYNFFAPFYVSAFYGHEEICRKICNFVVAETVKIDDQKEFLHEVLDEVVSHFNNVLMFETILKSVKKIRGQNALVKLLQSAKTRSDLSQIMVETMISTFVQDNNGYQDLNDVFFHEWRTLEILIHVQSDILQGMITAEGGFDNWIKRLIDTSFYKAFDVLSSNGFVAKFNQNNQIPKLIDILITKRPTERDATSCYWSELYKREYQRIIRDLLAALSKVASEDDLKRLLFSRDDNNVAFVFHYLISKNESVFIDILTDLPENLKQMFEDIIKEETPQQIDHFFLSPEFLESLESKQQWKAIEFYLKNGNQEQLSKFSQVVKVDQLEKVLKKEAETIWGRERCKKFAELLRVKLNSQTIVNYNQLIEKYN